jgi:hypothetical protein
MPLGAQPAAEIGGVAAPGVRPPGPIAGHPEDAGDGFRAQALDPPQVLDAPQQGEVPVVIAAAAAAGAVRPDETLALPQAERRRTDAEGPCSFTDPVGGDLSSARGALHGMRRGATSTRTLTALCDHADSLSSPAPRLVAWLANPVASWGGPLRHRSIADARRRNAEETITVFPELVLFVPRLVLGP